jgi:hypothetical protein
MYQRRQFTPAINKDAKIEKAIEHKEQNIKKYTDDKSISIAISSAFNGAKDIAVAIIEAGKKFSEEVITEKEFWEFHQKIYKDYLERFILAQIEGVEFYNQVKGRYQAIKDKELADVEISTDADLREDDPEPTTDNQV